MNVGKTPLEIERQKIIDIVHNPLLNKIDISDILKKIQEHTHIEQEKKKIETPA